jgi:hypothetical protein
MRGNSLINGNDASNGVPNGCSQKAGVTIRDKTKLPDDQCGTPPCEADNTIDLSGSAETIGTPAQQELGYDDFSPYTFSAAQLDALKALAQAEGTYIKPTDSSQFNLNVVNGLVFVDAVSEPLGTPPSASQLANVRITNANNSGWLIVMGSIQIDGNVTYNGFIYALNDLSYRGTGNGGIYGGVLTGNVLDSVATRVDSDSSGNSKIYYDCNKIVNPDNQLSPTVQDGLNRSLVTVNKGTWRELALEQPAP